MCIRDSGEGHRFFDALRNHQTIVRKESTKEFPEIAETSHLKMVDESVSFDMAGVSAEKSVYLFAIARNRSARSVSSS